MLLVTHQKQAIELEGQAMFEVDLPQETVAALRRLGGSHNTQKITELLSLCFIQFVRVLLEKETDRCASKAKPQKRERHQILFSRQRHCPNSVRTATTGDLQRARVDSPRSALGATTNFPLVRRSTKHVQDFILEGQKNAVATTIHHEMVVGNASKIVQLLGMKK